MDPKCRNSKKKCFAFSLATSRTRLSLAEKFKFFLLLLLLVVLFGCVVLDFIKCCFLLLSFTLCSLLVLFYLVFFFFVKSKWIGRLASYISRITNDLYTYTVCIQMMGTHTRSLDSVMKNYALIEFQILPIRRYEST